MQTLINILALSSFVVSVGVVGTGTYVYLNKDSLIEKAKAAAIEEVKDMFPSFDTPNLPLPNPGTNSPGLPPVTLPF